MNYTKYTKSELIEEVKTWKKNHDNATKSLDIQAKNMRKLLDDKDKLIKNMAMYISAQDIDEDICKNSNLCPEYDEQEVINDDCIKCILKYFSELEGK